VMRVLVALIGASLGSTPPSAGQQTAAFQLVKTAEYEGAIIPAADVPMAIRPRFSEMWTPMAAHVAQAERQLKPFLERAAKNHSQASDVIQTNQDMTFDGLPKLIKSLPTYKRQYIGVKYGETRHILIHGRPDDPGHIWRSQFRLSYASVSQYWWYEFNLTGQKVIEFTCQGIS